MAEERQVRNRNKRVTMGNISGLATSIDGPSMPLNVLAEADNVVYDIEGGARKREGFDFINHSFSDHEHEVVHYDKTQLVPFSVKYNFETSLTDDTSFILKNEIQGLSSDNIDKLIDDGKEYTLEYENKPDGSTYSHIPVDDVRCMFEDSDNFLYIGTDKGIYKQLLGVWTKVFTNFRNTYVNGMYQTKDKKIYLCTYDGLWSTKNYNEVELVNKELSSYNSMFQTDNGSIYVMGDIGTSLDSAFREYDSTTNKLIDINMDKNHIKSMFKMSDGRTLALGDSVFLYNESDKTFTMLNELNTSVVEMIETVDNIIYYHDEYSLYTWDKKGSVKKILRFGNTVRNNSLSSNSIGQVFAMGVDDIYLIDGFDDPQIVYNLNSGYNPDFIFTDSDDNVYYSERNLLSKLIFIKKDTSRLSINFKGDSLHIKEFSFSLKEFEMDSWNKHYNVDGTVTVKLQDGTVLDSMTWKEIYQKQEDQDELNNGKWHWDIKHTYEKSNSPSTNKIVVDLGIDDSNDNILQTFTYDILNLKVSTYKTIDDLYDELQNSNGEVVTENIYKIESDLIIYNDKSSNKIVLSLENPSSGFVYNKQSLEFKYTEQPSYIDYVVAFKRYIVITTGHQIFVAAMFKDSDSNTVALVSANDLDKLPTLNDIGSIEEFGYNRWLSTPTSYAFDRYKYPSLAINNIQTKNINPWVSGSKAVNYEVMVDVEDENTFKQLTYKWSIKIYDQEKTKYVDIDKSDVQAEVRDDTSKECNIIYNQPGKYKLNIEVTDPSTTKVDRDILINITADQPKQLVSDSVLSEIKKCKYVDFLEGKLVFYGNGTQQIYTSLLTDPFYFSAETVVLADTYNKSEELVAIESYKDIKVIFTESTMMSMSGYGDPFTDNPADKWTILPLDGTTGIVSHDAASPIMNTLAFVSKNGANIITQISVADKRVDLFKVSDYIKDLATPYPNLIKKDEASLMSNISMASVENRLYISYPDKGQLLVFDYSNTTDISKGKWSRWVSDGIKFGKIKNVGEQLYNLYEKRISIKRPKVEIELGDASLEGYYDDNILDGTTISTYPVKLRIATHHINFGEPLTPKKIKRIMVDTSNTFDGSSPYSITSLSDYQPNIHFEVQKTETNKPALGKMLTGKQGSMTTYRPDSNMDSKTFVVSKSGRVNNIVIEQNGNEPFELNSIDVDYMSGVPRGNKLKL